MANSDEVPLLIWHVNKFLPPHTDRDISFRYLPLNEENFYTAMGDGLLFCKLLLKMFPNVTLIRTVQTSIDMATIREPGSKSQYKVSQNFNTFFETCRKYNVKVAAVNVQDLISGRQGAILSTLSSLVLAYMLRTVSVLQFPELILLLDFDKENLQHLLDMDPVEILTRWVNYHMRRLKLSLRVKDIAPQYFQDGVIYLHLLKKLAGKKLPEDVITPGLNSQDPKERANVLLQQMRAVGIEIPLTIKDVTEGSTLFQFKVLSCLFCYSTGITLPTGHVVHGLATETIELIQQLNNLQKNNPAAKAAEAVAAAAAARAQEPIQRPLTPVDLTDALEQLEEMKDRHIELEQLLEQNVTKVAYLQDITSKQQAIINDLEDEADEERRAFDELLAVQKSNQNKVDRMKAELEAGHQKLAQIQVEISKLSSNKAPEVPSVTKPNFDEEDKVHATKFLTLTSRRDSREKKEDDNLIAQRIARVQLLQLAASLEQLTGNEYPHNRKDKDVSVMDKLNWLVEQLTKEKDQKQKRMQELVDNAKKAKQINDTMTGKIRVIAEELSKTPMGVCGR